MMQAGRLENPAFDVGQRVINGTCNFVAGLYNAFTLPISRRVTTQCKMILFLPGHTPITHINRYTALQFIHYGRQESQHFYGSRL
jgi:hypothetical protein